MSLDNNFGDRMDAYKARSDALGKAMEDQAVYFGLINIGTFIVVVIGAVVVWLHPSIRALLAMGLGVVVLRFVVRALFDALWVEPRMKRINREFPKPPSRYAK